MDRNSEPKVQYLGADPLARRNMCSPSPLSWRPGRASVCTAWRFEDHRAGVWSCSLKASSAIHPSVLFVENLTFLMEIFKKKCLRLRWREAAIEQGWRNVERPQVEACRIDAQASGWLKHGSLIHHFLPHRSVFGSLIQSSESPKYQTAQRLGCRKTLKYLSLVGCCNVGVYFPFVLSQIRLHVWLHLCLYGYVCTLMFTHGAETEVCLF